MHDSRNITALVAKPRSGQILATIGFRIACVGTLLAIYFALFFNTSVPLNDNTASAMDIDRASDIEWVQRQPLWMLICIAGAGIGAILIAAGYSKREDIDWKYVLFGPFACKKN